MRLIGLLVRNTVLREWEYRSAYWLLILSQFFSYAADYLLLKFSYGSGRTTFLANEEVSTFVLIGLVIRSSASQWGEVFSSSMQIRNGEFRRFLLQPVNYSTILMSVFTGEKLITWALLFGGMLIAHLIGGNALIQIPHALFWAFFIQALILTWSIYYAIVLSTFWFGDSNFLAITFNISTATFTGTLVPFDWLPHFAQKLVTFTPFRLLGDFPIRAALGKLSPDEIQSGFLLGLLWFFFLATLNTALFLRGTKRYESFGG